MKDMTAESLLRQYYMSFYRDQLGLKDWEQRIERRIAEEEKFASPVIDTLEQVLDYNFSGKKVLVVGAGTGAEFFALHKKGAKVYALEPNHDAVNIIKTKCSEYNIEFERISESFAENMLYPDDCFDFVYCYTVLEHVKDVKKTLHEIIRVTRTGGRIFIETPNYRMPYEPHYKMFMPTFMPRIFLKGYLWLRGRPIDFISSLNFISRGKLLNTIRHMPVLTLQILHSYPKEFARFNNPVYLFMRYLGIERDFWLILLKKAGV